MRLLLTASLLLCACTGLGRLAAADGDHDLGRFVREQKAKGVTGQALAAAIEERLLAAMEERQAAAGRGTPRPGDEHDRGRGADGVGDRPGKAPDHGDGQVGKGADAADDEGLGACVRELRAKGVRGQALADAIHQELARRHGEHGEGRDKAGDDARGRGPGKAGAGGGRGKR